VASVKQRIHCVLTVTEVQKISPIVYLKLKEMILKRVYLNYQRLQHMFTNCLQHIEAVTNVIIVASNLGSSDDFSKQ
jgi:hypothetical protein